MPIVIRETVANIYAAGQRRGPGQALAAIPCKGWERGGSLEGELGPPDRNF